MGKVLEYRPPCPICEWDERVNIDSALLAGQPVEKVAKFYNLDVEVLEHHKNFCASYLLSLDEFDAMVAKDLVGKEKENANAGSKKRGSLQRSLALREGDLLAATSQELFTTLKNIGRKINRFVDEATTPDGLAAQQRFLKLPLCQMYVGIASEIRQTVKTMADIDKQVNAAEPDNPASGLHALADAIKRTK